MALDTELYDMAIAIKNEIVSITDLEVTENDVYLHEVPQDVNLPAFSITPRQIKIIRVSPDEGQLRVVWLVEMKHGPIDEPDRAVDSLKYAMTVMRHFVKSPTLGDTAIQTDVAEGETEIAGTVARDQGCEILAFALSAFLEPINISAL